MKLGISHQQARMLNPGHLAYLTQMGVEAVEVRIPEAMSTYDEMARIRDRVEEAGLHLFEIMRGDRYDSPEIALGLPGRDREIERFKSFLKDLSRVGVDCTTYTWCTHSRHYAGAETMTRGCRTRSFELDAILKCPHAYDREYADEEMWANYEYFIREVLPVAEDVGVRLQLHPNDPPVTHEGVARIFRSTDAFRRAMEFSGHSPFSGMLFCVGTWAEMFGPDGKGEDIPAAIREFGARGQIYQVHFRNVSSPMPEFIETYPDDGYVNMYNVMKSLHDTQFQGMVVPDHVPICEDSDATPQAGEAYCFGYLRALMQAVQQPRSTSM